VHADHSDTFLDGDFGDRFTGGDVLPLFKDPRVAKSAAGDEYAVTL